MIQEAILVLSRQQDLSREQMHQAMEEIMSGKANTEDIVSLLNLMNKKGETVEELTAAVEVLRKHVTPIRSSRTIILDTCGTGGDRKGTFNVSTASAFVASGAGISVAKHGNRSVSSISGSADVLEALGVNINMDREKIEKCLEEIGIAFLFAPNLHPAMKFAMPARKQIAHRTIFNILGPLSNPANATHQLVGVYDKGLAQSVAQVLKNLGSTHALVVHGEDGLDELTTTAKTFVSESNLKEIKSYEISPEDFGIKRVEPQELKGGDAYFNAGILKAVLSGKAGAYRDIVLLNSGAAIYAADKASSIKEGIAKARESIDSGEASQKLELLRQCSQER